MQVNLVANGKVKSQIDVTDAVFAQEFNEALVHHVVTAYLAGARSGTKAQKSRGQVSGTGKKPWAQKGTGRARAGSFQSPLWRSGGVTFAAVPRDYSQKVNRKAYRAAIRSILSELIRQERLIVVSDLKIAEPKTKALMAQLEKLNAPNCLIIVDDLDANLYLASRNLHRVFVLDVEAIDPVSLIANEKLIITESALKKVEEWLS